MVKTSVIEAETRTNRGRSKDLKVFELPPRSFVLESDHDDIAKRL